MKITGVRGSTDATRCSSATEWAPKLETSATWPGKSRWITSSSTSPAPQPSKRSASRSAWASAASAGSSGSGRANASSSAIERLLEGCRADAAIGVKEGLGLVLTVGDVGVDDGLDRIDDFGGREPLADDLADRCAFIAGAAERDLVKLLALLLDAEDADMAGVVVAAGVDAAGDLDLQRADLLLPRGIGEPLGDTLGNGN